MVMSIISVYWKSMIRRCYIISVSAEVFVEIFDRAVNRAGI